jgi:hypothetical protein
MFVKLIIPDDIYTDCKLAYIVIYTVYFYFFIMKYVHFLKAKENAEKRWNKPNKVVFLLEKPGAEEITVEVWEDDDVAHCELRCWCLTNPAGLYSPPLIHSLIHLWRDQFLTS